MVRTPGAKIALVVSLLLAMGIAGFVFHDITKSVSDGNYKQEIQQEYEVASAYCYQVYGDADITNERVLGNHGGWHCMGNDGGDPHLHDVTDEAKQAAYQANQSNTSVDWSAVQRYKPESERADVWFYPETLAFTGLSVVVIGLLLKLKRVNPGDE